MIGEKVNNRYILHHVINIGGMGVIYRASDLLLRGTPDEFVALKRVLAGTTNKTDASRGRVALAREFHVLATLRHPNIISVLDYGFDNGGMPFYTMELLEDAQTFTAAGKDLSLDEQVQLFIQLLQALAYLHRHHIVHRDIKPANVLVAPNNHLKVLDFGLASLHEQSAANNMVGTLKYMAPELLVHQPSTLTSDLYAAGLLAFEMITSTYPYEEVNTQQLLHDILSKSVDMTPLHMVAHQHGLDEVQRNRFVLIFERLLAKDPRARYTSAYEVIEELCITLNMPLPAENAAIRAGYIESARFVGRDEELRLLEDALAQVIPPLEGEPLRQESGGSMWLIGGEGGIGKSRLLEELRIRALVRGVLVLSGNGDAEVKRPFAWWGDVVRRLIIEVPITDYECALLKYIVPDLPRILDRNIDDIKPDENRGDFYKRLSHLIIDLLRRATQENQRAVVLLLDDLHAADEESFLPLQELQTAIPEFRLLVIGAYRDEDVQSDAWLRLPDANHIQLNRLNLDAITQLTVYMLGETGAQPHVIDLIQRETEGNLFFLVEVIRALAEDAGGLQNIGLITLPEHVLVGSVERLIQRRLDRVPPESRALLRLAAVAGREIDIRLLSHIIMRGDAPTVPVGNLDAWLVMCAEASVLEVRDNVWRFTHDKLREYIIGHLSNDEFRKFHRLIAESLTELYGDSPHYFARLAYHWRKARDYHKEREYAILAGEYAFQHGNARQAIYYLARALQLDAELTTDNAIHTHLLLNLGLSYIQTGDLSRAQGILNRVLQEYRTADDTYGQGKTLLGLGRLYHAFGEYKVALHYLSECLDIMMGLGKKADIAHALVEIGQIQIALDRYESAVRTLLEARSIFQELNNQHGMALALQEIAHVMLEQGALGEARAYFHEAQTFLLQADDYRGVVASDLSLSEIALQDEDAQTALYHIMKALRQALNIGAIPLLLQGIGLYAQWLFQQGDGEQAAELVGMVWHHATTDGDLRTEFAPFIKRLKANLNPTAYMAAFSRGEFRNPQMVARNILSHNNLDTRIENHHS